MSGRRLPRLSELRPLLPPAPIGLHPVRRSVERAATVVDLREIGRRRVPRAVFDYVDGGADQEISLRRSRERFAQLEFQPGVLRNVAEVDTSTTLLGREADYPFVFAPTGFTRMMHHEGEPAVARVARDIGVPYVLSTLGTTTPEDLAARVVGGDKWFQLYLWRDRAASADLVGRVEASGYRTLVLTVDVPVSGNRLRDLRNGLTIPPTLRLRTLVDGARHPSWWINLLTTEPLTFASLDRTDGPVAELINRVFDPAMTLDDLGWLRARWTGPLVVKGVQSAADAEAVVGHGADAVVISNHGGRQLDRAPTPLDVLPSVVHAVAGRAEIYLDGGVLTGADIVAALALGARACLVGRAYLYGLMAGGAYGVERTGQILTTELRRTMQLLGVRALDQLRPDHVRRVEQPGPNPS
jgi:L-lactate dehydrogenase (cytochrome)